MIDRRGFLSLAGLGAAGLAFLPRLRRARAAELPARARRLLVLHLSGGIRSSAGFLASGNVTYNPYGLIEGTGTPFALGRLLDDTPPGSPPLGDDAYTLGAAWGGARLPRLREVAGELSVVGTWSEARGDHLRARVEEPTGSPDGADPGLVTRVIAGLAALHGGAPEIPGFHLAPDALFGAAGRLARHAPVALAGWYSLPSAAAADPFVTERTADGWVAGTEMAERRDRRVVEVRAGAGRVLADTHALHRGAARSIGRRLGQADMQVADYEATGAALGEVALAAGSVPLTNAMLYELTTRALGPMPEYDGDVTGSEHFNSAINAAVAVRLLQLGSPAVALEIESFDYHSDERTQAPALYGFLGRLWASLGWLLRRIPDPAGGTMFDSTLVVTTSDFGRDPAGPRGWNGGDGSDHGADPGCFYLAHAVMGGGVRGGQLIGGVSTEDYDARRETVQIAPVRLLGTLLSAVGLDPEDPDVGFATAGAPIAELWS
jgi:uncharacterized protein (DUF1501 family)